MHALNVLKYSHMHLSRIYVYKNVDYDDGNVICNFCETEWMGKKETCRHFHSSRHMKRHN